MGCGDILIELHAMQPKPRFGYQVHSF